jgi:hypothetical protein
MVAQATLSGDEEEADAINSQSLINTLNGYRTSEFQRNRSGGFFADEI